VNGFVAATGRPSEPEALHSDDPLLPGRGGRTPSTFSTSLTVRATEFEPASWDAFQRTSLRGERPARAWAAQLNLSINAVYIARSRVLQRFATAPGMGFGWIDQGAFFSERFFASGAYGRTVSNLSA